MPPRQARRLHRPLTPAEQQRLRKAREETDAEKESILAEARKWKSAHESGAATLRDAFRLLKAERERQGLSLADLRDRTGIARSALSRLENDLEANPTITTLTRYAEALGKRLLVVVADAENS